MKKALAILSALALVAGVASADTSIGAWGRNIFVPVSSDDTATNLGTSWSNTPRIGFTASGSTENVGFQVDMVADYSLNSSSTDNYIGFGDQQKVWIKPFAGLLVQFGNAYEDTLRGNAAFGSFGWIRMSWTGEDVTFTRIASSSGIVLSYTGIENLFVAARMNASAATASDKAPVVMLKSGQYAIGYTLADIGQIRAQYIGGTTAGTIEAAFKITAVQNLYADVGARLSIATASATVDLNPVISGYVNYKMDALTIHALAVASVKTATGAKSGLELGAGVDYNLDGGVAINADLRAGDVLNNGFIGGFAGVSKGFSNGKIGVGIEYTTKSFAPGYASKTDGSFAVPVLVEYWF